MATLVPTLPVFQHGQTWVFLVLGMVQTCPEQSWNDPQKKNGGKSNSI